MKLTPFIIAFTLLGPPAFAQTPSDFPPAISVTGEAHISVPPDLASVDAGVATDAKTAREASDTNNTAMAKVLAALKAANIDAKDIQTSRLSLQPQYAPNRGGPSPIVGYRASNRVTVRIHDVSKVAGVIDTLVGAGANDVGNVSFSVSQASKLLDDAREKAVADARRKAEVYARAAGVTLGAPLSIAEEGAPQPIFRGKMVAAMAAVAPTPIAQGEETLSVSVAVTWAIKQGQ
ncbi:MAG TPA: SIMPL domain-containing protein [Bradyrhizobium sp.]|uniref:SIMPL domain-containing protein n=1 Tax=Bradyrhizobium sp. TaxID=376 RepID=UPI002D1B04C0|nr:SIMPL domain-containing protein [Bradyrhizobium sp.]HLZ01522.1 SIMPL domain-containing protein [Bradyrhizobium sp.]